MIGKDAIAITDVFPVDFFYGSGNLFVDLFPLLREDGIIDDLSCEGVLEDVGAVGIDAPFIEEFGVSECGQIG
jgi:hypothetical protein